MQDSDESPFLVGADRPVNRRTAKPLTPRPAAKPTPQLQARWQNLDGQLRMGAPLGQILLQADPASRHALHAARLRIYTALAASAIAIVLSLAIAGPPLGYALAGAFAVLGLGGAALGLRALRRHANAAALHLTGLDSDRVRALDTALEQAAAALREPELLALQRLKGSLVAVAESARNASPVHWSPDDQGWLLQCVGRYLPDSLHAYLSIPKEHRNQSLQEGGHNAHDVLQSQLESLQRKLDTLHAQLVADKAERLLMQQRFLAAKEKGL